ncbi:MAG: hypothetical protein CL846_06590 [Crocinitomicaceae bacterium]|nr:hypothetical protein [Crocinitomicaceae bacterium]|tara:strand:- start:1834 stop:2235 length:402 start_codon:yes stop_codon:yes gene_type:complete
MINNITTRVEEIQGKISQSLGLSNNQVVFEFNKMPNYVDLDLFTINAIHKQQFFFHSTEGRDEIEALELMLKYVKNQLIIDDSFTIQWKLKGSTEIHQSHFRAKNMMDALDKFYFGRSVSSITIYSIVLNPLA